MFEIHNRECPYIPDLGEREYIGIFKNPKEALKKAIHAHPNASLCAYCCKSSLLKGMKQKQPPMKK